MKDGKTKSAVFDQRLPGELLVHMARDISAETTGYAARPGAFGAQGVNPIPLEAGGV
jgi:hypothetical protein